MVPNQMRSSRNPSIAYFLFHLLECKGRVLLDKSPLRFFGPVSILIGLLLLVLIVFVNY